MNKFKDRFNQFKCILNTNDCIILQKFLTECHVPDSSRSTRHERLKYGCHHSVHTPIGEFKENSNNKLLITNLLGVIYCSFFTNSRPWFDSPL